MTLVVIDINKILVSDFSDMNHKDLWSLLVRLRSRFHRSHLVGQIFTFDITKINNKDLRP